MPQTSAQWADALAPGIREWFFAGVQSEPSYLSQLFNVQTSESAEEFFYSFGAVSPEAWDDYEASGRVPKVAFDKGYKSTFTHKEYPAEIDIQRKLVDDAISADHRHGHAARTLSGTQARTGCGHRVRQCGSCVKTSRREKREDHSL